MTGVALCPRCQSDKVYRSRNRRIWDGCMRIFGLRPFRCRECESRFYLAGGVAEQAEGWRKRRKRRRRE